METSPARKTPAEWLRCFRKRPLCIICARPSEAQMIANELGCEKNKVSNGQIAGVDKNHVFYYGSFDLANASLDFYITSSLRQGIQSFTIHTSILFHTLKPRYAIHAGVCAGFADRGGKIKEVITEIGSTEMLLTLLSQAERCYLWRGCCQLRRRQMDTHRRARNGFPTGPRHDSAGGMQHASIC